MYKGYEIGIVYSFDAPYLEWCIKNVSDFYIDDLDELEKFGVIRCNQKYDVIRQISDGTLNDWVNYFLTIQDIVRKFGLACTSYRFSETTRSLNESRIRNNL